MSSANENGDVSRPIGGSSAVQSSPNDSVASDTLTSSQHCHADLTPATGAKSHQPELDVLKDNGSMPVVLDARRRRCSAPGVGHGSSLSDGCTARKLSASLAGAPIQFTPTPPPSPSHRGLVANEPYVFAWSQVSAVASSLQAHLLQPVDSSSSSRKRTNGRRLSDPGAGRRWTMDTQWPTLLTHTDRHDVIGTPPPNAAVNCPLSESLPAAQDGEGGTNPHLMVTPASPIAGSDNRVGGSTVVTKAPTRRHSVALGHLSSRYLEVIAEETGIIARAGLNDAGAAGAAAAGVESADNRRHSLTGGVS